MEYRVSSCMGDISQMKEIIKNLTKEVTANIRAGATLVGGISVTYLDEGQVSVSQAFTIQKGIVDNLI
jgi:hypothetical protein